MSRSSAGGGDELQQLRNDISGQPDDAHALLMALYKDPRKEITIRLDAAKAAAPYEKPKLASTEIKGDADKPLQQKLVIEFVRGPGR